jgi:hypothetical protein
MRDVASRLTHRVQLTTDGLRSYLEAVEEAFGGDTDYAMVIKLYGEGPEGRAAGAEARYSPGEVVGRRTQTVVGEPDPRFISTSYTERQNLTMRMGMRRFTRPTNGFSKKVENLEHAVALHYLYYNFCRIHQTLRVTPATAAGVTSRLWEIEDIVGLID